MYDSLSALHIHIHTESGGVAVGFRERKVMIDMFPENFSSVQWVQNNFV